MSFSRSNENVAIASSAKEGVGVQSSAIQQNLDRAKANLARLRDARSVSTSATTAKTVTTAATATATPATPATIAATTTATTASTAPVIPTIARVSPVGDAVTTNSASLDPAKVQLEKTKALLAQRKLLAEQRVQHEAAATARLEGVRKAVILKQSAQEESKKQEDLLRNNTQEIQRLTGELNAENKRLLASCAAMRKLLHPESVSTQDNDDDELSEDTKSKCGALTREREYKKSSQPVFDTATHFFAEQRDHKKRKLAMKQEKNQKMQAVLDEPMPVSIFTPKSSI